MGRNILTALALFASACQLPAAPVKVHGYVTGIVSPKAFDVDGYRVTRDDSLAFDVDKGDFADATFRPEDLRVGTEVSVEGDFNDAKHELKATAIKISINGSLRIKRTAVIEHSTVLQRVGAGWRAVIHADGETIRVGSETRVTLKDGQTNQLTPGVSIAYEGRREKDGSVVATRLEIVENDTHRNERKLFRELAPKLTANGEIVVRGARYKLIPDAEAQSYVQRIGTKLVPNAYHQDLSGGATRLFAFQFYLIENADFNAHAFPNGTVLVNSGVLRVLTSEAQFAAVLGHEIAHATQEHAAREMQHQKNDVESLRAKGYAGTKGDSATNGYTRSLENQADRVGLEYMVTAGYDPREAAEVWNQSARNPDQKADFLWNNQDDTTMRRSYLLAQVRNNYATVDLRSYTRDSEEFDNLAQRFGNTAVVQQKHNAPVSAPASQPATAETRPDYQKPQQYVTSGSANPISASVSTPAAADERHLGANAVTIVSDPAGADVLLNGMVIGKTPLTLPTGAVGLPFTITLQKAGFRGWTGQLVTVPGRTNLRVELFPVQ
ncbi:MAG TPA: M48 family metalloprotease [Bryobacteraceae bacterium]|jgi:hypothetical protein